MTALKYLFSVFLISFSFLFFSASAYADTTTQTVDPCQGKTTVQDKDPITPCNYFDAQNGQNSIDTFTHGIECSWLFGIDLTTQDPNYYCFGHTKNGLSAYVDSPVPGGSAIAAESNVLVALYSNPPISSTEYLADMGSNLGIVSPAYAQVNGAGSNVLSPILQVWQVTRNITYLAFIMIFMIVGFMIMMRQKINAQTVVTVQNALPGLVLGLILVTFSYLIAALIVDVAFIGSNLVVNIIKSAHVVGTDGTVYNPSSIYDPSSGDNILTIMKNLVFDGKNFGIIISPLQDTFSSIFKDTLGGIVGGGIGKVLGFGLGTLATLIIGFAIIIQMFRLLFELIKCYISILIMTVLGPFIILGASVPGRSAALGGWWRPLLANALVFPVVIGAFLFAGIFLNTSPKAPVEALPLFGGVKTDILRVVLGYAMILITPAIPKHVKDALKAPDHPIGGHAMEGALVGAGFAGAAGGIVGRRAVNRAYGVAEATRQRYTATGATPPGWVDRVQRGIDRTWSPTRTNAQGHRMHGWRSTDPHLGPWWKPW
jgi:hypothetical protein